MLQRIYGTAWAQQGGTAAVPEDAGGGREARPPPAGPRARPVPHATSTRRAWCSGTPRAGRVWQQVEQYMRRVYRENGYQEVKGPQLLDKSLWEKTGHWDKYRENMFTTESEKRDYALKPMNCPGPHPDLQAGHEELPRPAAALRRVRPVPPQRAHGRAARHHAGARLHPGRRPHLLHRGADPGRSARPTRRCCRRSTATSASPTSSTRSRPGPTSASAPTRAGTRPSTR